jgi:hypothetical protein
MSGPSPVVHYGFREGQPVQVIHAPAPATYVEGDLRGVLEAEREGTLAQRVRVEADRAIDLSTEGAS